jgi:biotin-[acetyl-CoA-carboxylase] ligase BirA-like protein
MPSAREPEWQAIIKTKISSTSDYAKDLLQAGCSPPLVVAACSQTKGRGQSNHSWASPVGNLYLSFVITEKVFPGHLIPHKIAILISEWVYSRYKVRLTIKWPNDILFAGYKLAGILCECRTSNDKENIIIGIGLNLNSSPLENSTCLAEVIGKEKLPVSDCQQDFILWFKNKWDEITIENILDRYYFFYIGDNHLWEKENKKFFLSQKMTFSGELSLKEQKTRKIETLVSATHGFSWVHQKNCDSTFFPMYVVFMHNKKIFLGIFANDKDECDCHILDFEKSTHIKLQNVFVYVLDYEQTLISFLDKAKINYIKVRARPVLSAKNHNSCDLSLVEGSLVVNLNQESNEIYLRALGLKSIVKGGILFNSREGLKWII